MTCRSFTSVQCQNNHTKANGLKWTNIKHINIIICIMVCHYAPLTFSRHYSKSLLSKKTWQSTYIYIYILLDLRHTSHPQLHLDIFWRAPSLFHQVPLSVCSPGHCNLGKMNVWNQLTAYKWNKHAHGDTNIILSPWTSQTYMSQVVSGSHTSFFCGSSMDWIKSEISPTQAASSTKTPRDLQPWAITIHGPSITYWRLNGSKSTHPWHMISRYR